MIERDVEAAADAIRRADALLVSAGAGMGVDSGLPDFRGTEGFWKAYPPFAKLGLRIEELADPAWFDRDPAVAWGFYGHRLNLYRATVPHPGFEVLRRWAAGKPAGAFVFTSNVDGQFQKAGFDPQRVVECHGSVHHLQCARRCRRHVWPADGAAVEVDEATMRATEKTFPVCPRCSCLARPNVLMFYDAEWVRDRTAAQQAAYAAWLKAVSGARLVVVECGAGTAIPTVRMESERAAQRYGAMLVRINVREPEVPPGGHVGLPLGAAEALRRVDEAMRTGRESA